LQVINGVAASKPHSPEPYGTAGGGTQTSQGLPPMQSGQHPSDFMTPLDVKSWEIWAENNP